MKLLFDEMLSYRLATFLEESFPGSASVNQGGLQGRPDTEVWYFAAQHGFAIVTKDDDFRQLSFALGHPPKVVWLGGKNAGTGWIKDILLWNRCRIAGFLEDNEGALLELYLDIHRP